MCVLESHTKAVKQVVRQGSRNPCLDPFRSSANVKVMLKSLDRLANSADKHKEQPTAVSILHTSLADEPCTSSTKQASS